MGKLKAAAPRLSAPRSRLRLPPKKVDDFYKSKEWKALAARMKKRAGYKCEVPGCGSSHRIIADHIIERKDGGADLDPSNIQILCSKHHNEKTAKAKRARAQR